MIQRLAPNITLPLEKIMKVKIWFSIMEDGKVLDEPISIDKEFSDKLKVGSNITITDDDASGLSDMNREFWAENFGSGQYNVCETKHWDTNKQPELEQAVSVAKIEAVR